MRVYGGGWSPISSCCGRTIYIHCLSCCLASGGCRLHASTRRDLAPVPPADTLVSELTGLMGSAGGGGDPSEPGAGGVDDFELLFSQLAELRAAAARAPPEQRHDLAERVAMAFLRSMGGDEDGPDEDSG